MKKIIIASYLLLISFINLHGQWYVKQYKVSDINFLSKAQLEESLGKSKTGLLFSGLIAGTGGAIILISRYFPYQLSEDATFIEQLIGEKGMNDIGFACGAGFLIGGTIASIANLGRIGRIKSVINNNYASVGSLNILPTAILNSYTKSFCPGFTLRYNF